MAKTLKGRAPDAGRPTKPKFLIFGPPSVGKTWVAIDFPRAYYIDTEGGASQPQYQRKLLESGGTYFGPEDGARDFNSVVDQVEALATNKHDYLTVVIDSFSKVYLSEAALHESRVGNTYGADKKEANKPTRQLMRWLDRLDMNVVLVCHEKEKWEKKPGGKANDLVSVGKVFDGYEKLEYDLHLCLRVTRDGATVYKSRLEGFPYGETFPWNFKEFERRAGKAVMLRPVVPVVLPEAAEVNEVRRLLHAAKMKPGWEQDVFSKAGVTRWEELDRDKVLKCIEYLKTRVEKPEDAKKPDPPKDEQPPEAPTGGDDPADEPPGDPDLDAISSLRARMMPHLRKAAEAGTESMRSFWATMSEPARAACSPDLPEIESVAQEADENAARQG